MNILNHMMYSHDSKIYPETLAKMEGVSPKVKEYENKKGFCGSIWESYQRTNG